jgi:hypothetical protein
LQGDAGEATRTLDQAKSVLKDHIPGFDADGWNEWLPAHIPYGEAEALLRAKKIEPPKYRNVLPGQQQRGARVRAGRRVAHRYPSRTRGLAPAQFLS